MQRPSVVNELANGLALNAIALIFGGALALSVGLTDSGPGMGTNRVVGIAFLLLGIFIGIVTIEFRALKPWAYRIVKILFSRWLGMKGAAGLDRRLDDPEVLRAFGFKSETGQDPK